MPRRARIWLTPLIRARARARRGGDRRPLPRIVAGLPGLRPRPRYRRGDAVSTMTAHRGAPCPIARSCWSSIGPHAAGRVGESRDRIEREPDAFHDAVVQGFDQAAGERYPPAGRRGARPALPRAGRWQSGCASRWAGASALGTACPRPARARGAARGSVLPAPATPTCSQARRARPSACTPRRFAAELLAHRRAPRADPHPSRPVRARARGRRDPDGGRAPHAPRSASAPVRGGAPHLPDPGCSPAARRQRQRASEIARGSSWVCGCRPRSDHVRRMLPTIRSRVATIPFRRFTQAQLEAEVAGDAQRGSGGAGRASTERTNWRPIPRRPSGACSTRRLAAAAATDPQLRPPPRPLPSACWPLRPGAPSASRQWWPSS